MTNPKAPRRSRSASQVEDPLDGFISRMSRLGAKPDELALIREHWDDFGDDWTPELRAELMATSDADLAAMLSSNRTEFDESTMTADEIAQRDHDAALRRAFADAHGRIGLTIARIAEWVEDDAVKAEAVIMLEERSESPRKGLIDRMRAVIGKVDGAES